MNNYPPTAQKQAADSLARRALFSFARQATVPILILGLQNEPPIPRGTGVLFCAQDRHFLITAEHVLKDVAVGRIAIPPRGRKMRLQPIGTVRMWLPEDRRYDVGILEFLEPEPVAWLKQFYNFVGPENIGNADMDVGAFLCGFPESFVTVTPEKRAVSGKPLVVDSTLLKKIPAGLTFPFVPGFEIFAEYRKKGYAEDGCEIRTPELFGASGCGVWQYVDPKPGVWTAHSGVRLVAVQSSFRHDEFFRAMTWAAVHQGFLSLDPAIAQDIYDAVFPGSRTA